MQEKSGLSKEEAVIVINNVLEIFAERLNRIHRKHLATQLPGDLKLVVNKVVATKVFSLESFYLRVAARAESSFHKAIEHSKSVFNVIQEAVSKGEVDDIFNELPPEFRELLGQKQIRISPTTVDTHELYR